jgi:hypothetical protein
LLREQNACEDARDWAKEYDTASAAWLACHRPDWMLWGLELMGYRNKRKLIAFAAWCARNTPLADGRKVWDLLTDQRSRDGVEAAERYAAGKPARAAAAWAAAACADAARAAAARAAAARAAAAWAAAACADAARAAAARAAAARAQADALREIMGNPFAAVPSSTNVIE